jgi:hypothetical protein
MHVLLPNIREDHAVLSTVKLGPKNYFETAQHYCVGKEMKVCYPMANIFIPSYAACK